MVVASSNSHRTTLIGRKLAIPFEAILVTCGAVGVAVAGPTLSVWLLVMWAVAALIYLLVAGWLVFQAVRSPEKKPDSPARG